MKSVRAVISGRVQGVGYRAWTAANARKLGLCGWVRNRRDGTVEALFQGEVVTVDAMLTLCQDGPLAARVVDIRTEVAEWEMISGFEQRETA